MSYVELDSFIGKYKFLVSAGIEATLKFDSCNGEVKVSLEANLGKVSVNDWHQKRFPNVSNSRGPSYERRQQRRKKEAVEKTIKSESEVSSCILEEAADKVAVSDTKPVEAAVQSDNLVLNNTHATESNLAITTEA